MIIILKSILSTVFYLKIKFEFKNVFVRIKNCIRKIYLKNV